MATILEQLEANPTTASDTNLGVFTRAFMEAAIFCEGDELDEVDEDEEDQVAYEGEPADIDQFSEESLKACVKQCTDFVWLAVLNGFLPAGFDSELYTQAGHDFWLTRNGHGTGFWDRDGRYGETADGRDIGKLLSSLCDTFGQFPDVDLERGDDGFIHLFPLTITLHPSYTVPEGITGTELLNYPKY
jgi:hypothetical protein